MHALPQRGDVIGRKYRISSQLGAGGMGVVFEAINVDTEGKVAVKWLNPQLSSSHEAKERFKREAKVTARIQHPNVVAVHDCGEDEGQLYLVMELLRGKSLRERLTRAPMPAEEVCRIMLPVIRGVAAAHAVGVLHRDLKPENIFLCDSPDGLEPIPKVLDFGIAKLNTESADETALSAHSALMGTYQYMAPEQLRRRRDLDARVDVYAIGVVLFRMLTGELPYDAHNPVDLALQVLQSDAPPISALVPSLPDALTSVIAKSVARDRDARFGNMNELAVALEPFSGGLRYRGSAEAAAQIPEKTRERPVVALPTPFASTLKERERLGKRKWTIAAGAALATASAAWLFVASPREAGNTSRPEVALDQAKAAETARPATVSPTQPAQQAEPKTERALALPAERQPTPAPDTEWVTDSPTLPPQPLNAHDEAVPAESVERDQTSKASANPKPRPRKNRVGAAPEDGSQSPVARPDKDASEHGKPGRVGSLGMDDF